MALPIFQATIVNSSGDIIQSPVITVVDEKTGSAADLYQDRNGTTPLGSGGVFSGTTQGFAQFYAAAGVYRVTAEQASSGFSQTWRYVSLLDTDQALSDADIGTASDKLPKNANLSTSVTGTATFSSDTYAFSPSGTGFRTLEAGMYISFKLPSGSANTTTTPDIDYDGTTYTIKWIDGSALETDDLNETYNKQPILFYFDGTDMLIASDISGSNADGEWLKESNGNLTCISPDISVASVSISIATAGGFRSGGGAVGVWTFPKQFSNVPNCSPVTLTSEALVLNFNPSISSVSPTMWRATSGTVDTSWQSVAHGRWY